MTEQRTRASDLLGRPVHDRSGHVFGHVEDVLLDDTGHSYLSVNLSAEPHSGPHLAIPWSQIRLSTLITIDVGRSTLERLAAVNGT
ncbi:MAG: PRC-barrel domain-containing protein [Xanthomonadales bacterium]|nr:PRC-barrel domain-containing protein [Xanthomonadales bacterium]